MGDRVTEPARTRPAASLAVRRLQMSDLPRAAELWALAFDVELPDESARANMIARLAFSLQTDPHGSFVAEREGRLMGLAQALLRERLWVLSALAVAPGSQSAGAGGALLEHALRYGVQAPCRLVVSSNDPRALALYARAGLAARPTLQGEGRPHGAAIARAARAFVQGDAQDVPRLAEISRAIRGAPHTSEILYALQQGSKLLIGDGGFAVVRPGSGVWLLVAREESEASELLLGSLALVEACDRPVVRWVSEDQRWALEVLERAGLAIQPYGALCVAGDPGPLRPFIPSGSFA